MQLETFKNKLDLKELELNSLLEITQSVNMNLSEDSLYKIYHFTLRANLNIKKLALFVLDEQWNCRVNFGTDYEFSESTLPEEYQSLREITALDKSQEENPFAEFDTLIPVAHKDELLAMVFVSNEEQKDQAISTNFIQALSNIILVAIENKKLARRQLRQEAYKKELEIASQVQQLLFPRSLPQRKTLQIEASYLPHHRVGGDYYDYIQIDEDRFLICIADVSGKGVPAAILMSNFQASLRTMARITSDLSDIVKELNYQLLQNAKGENFITFFIAVVNTKERTLKYVNAGHNPPIFACKKGTQLLESGTTILGMFHPLPFLNEGTLEGFGECMLFSYTDGLSETENEMGELYGFERLEEFICENWMEKPSDIHKLLLDELNSFKGKRDYGDDITLLTCKVAQN